MRLNKLACIIALLFTIGTGQAHAEVDVTIVAKDEGVSPFELWAIQILESGLADPSNIGIRPHPYTLRYGKGVVRRFETAEEYRAAGKKAEAEHPQWTIDVGAGQINRKWQAQYFLESSTLDPYDPEDNLRISAIVLRKAIESTQDRVQGLGRYYSWDDSSAKWYGSRAAYLADLLQARYKNTGMTK